MKQILRRAKRCYKCQKLMPSRQSARVITVQGKRGLYRRRLCTECVHKGWRFDEHGNLVQAMSKAFNELLATQAQQAAASGRTGEEEES